MTDFRVDGTAELRALVRDLDLATYSSVKRTRDAVRKHTFAVERGAKVRAAVDTGAMRNSTNSSFSGSTVAPLSGSGLTSSEPIVGEVGPEVSYGIFVELGTWRMAPQPFLGPAFDEVEPSFLAALEDIAGQALG